MEVMFEETAGTGGKNSHASRILLILVQEQADMRVLPS
jgi:hypothetical protein